MTVGELKESLSYLDDNIQIKVALQPSYPMKGSLMNLCTQHAEEGDVLWLAVSGNQDYGVPPEVWDMDEIGNEDEED